MPNGKIITKNNILYYNNQEIPTYDSIRSLRGQLLTSTTQTLTNDVAVKFYVPSALNSYSKFFIHIIIPYTPASSSISQYRYWLWMDDGVMIDGEYLYHDRHYQHLVINLYDNIYYNALSNMSNNYVTIKIRTLNDINTQQIVFKFGIFA